VKDVLPSGGPVKRLRSIDSVFGMHDASNGNNKEERDGDGFMGLYHADSTTSAATVEAAMPQWLGRRRRYGGARATRCLLVRSC
jgi:hypothetical protein